MVKEIQNAVKLYRYAWEQELTQVSISCKEGVCPLVLVVSIDVRNVDSLVLMSS